MKKWMLCVLALAVTGLTLNTAEAGGRRGCRGGRCSGGYVAGGWNGQAVSTSSSSGGYTVAYQSETSGTVVRPPLQQTTAVQTTSPITSGVPVQRVEATSVPVESTPSYLPAYQSGFSGRMVGRCSGSR